MPRAVTVPLYALPLAQALDLLVYSSEMLRQGWSRGGEAAAQATGAAEAVATMLQMLDGKVVTLIVSGADGGDEPVVVNPH